MSQSTSNEPGPLADEVVRQLIRDAAAHLSALQPPGRVSLRDAGDIARTVHHLAAAAAELSTVNRT